MPESNFLTRGYTLLELIAVIGIVAIFTAVAAPISLSNKDAAIVDAAGYELVNALRQAQSRSRNQSVYTAVRFQQNTSIDVLEVDDVPDPPEATTTRILHPLTKRDYTLKLDENPETSGVGFDTSGGPFQHADSTVTEFLFFDPQGRPFVVGNSGIGLLSGANLVVNAGKVSKMLVLNNISGRAQMQDVP